MAIPLPLQVMRPHAVSSRTSIQARPSGVRRAFLCVAVLFPGSALTFGNISLPAQMRGNISHLALDRRRQPGRGCAVASRVLAAIQRSISNPDHVLRDLRPVSGYAVEGAYPEARRNLHLPAINDETCVG